MRQNDELVKFFPSYLFLIN